MLLEAGPALLTGFMGRLRLQGPPDSAGHATGERPRAQALTGCRVSSQLRLCCAEESPPRPGALSCLAGLALPSSCTKSRVTSQTLSPREKGVWP